MPPDQWVSILTRLEGRVQPDPPQLPLVCGVVSILTRLEGRVQQLRTILPPPDLAVSILTRLEGRVQHAISFDSLSVLMFQSSPDSKVGCNPKAP